MSCIAESGHAARCPERHAARPASNRKRRVGRPRLIDFVLEPPISKRAALHVGIGHRRRMPGRIADIQTRLVDIDAHSAPGARSNDSLQGLGFDNAKRRNRALSEFSGGWRMRVALAAVLFSQPGLPAARRADQLSRSSKAPSGSSTIWPPIPATMLVISHDRDLLDAVCDHILHLDQCQADALEAETTTASRRQRREQQAIAAEAPSRSRRSTASTCRAFVDRFRAKRHRKRGRRNPASRCWSALQPIAAMVDSDVLPIVLPSPLKEPEPADHRAWKAPEHRLWRASGALEAQPEHLERRPHRPSRLERQRQIDLRQADRRPVARAMTGAMRQAPRSSTVGFFAQHQVEELDKTKTPLRVPSPSIMKRHAPRSENPRQMRAVRLSGNEGRHTRGCSYQGGEKARLMMGLATFRRSAPAHSRRAHQPSGYRQPRPALIEAINDYEGAIILIAHDRLPD